MVFNRYIPALILIFFTVAGYLPADPANAPTALKTSLNLKLWGTITGQNIDAYAIIEDMKTRRQRLYKAGDSIRNATIAMILRDKVVLKVGEHIQTLDVESGRPDVNARDEYGVTALIDASSKGQKDIVELLILEGADLNARDNQGDTALMIAALKGHLEIVKLLIANGAVLSLKDKSGNTALIESAKYGREFACEIIAVLAQNGARIDAANRFGMTAVMYAAQGGHVENVSCLIAAGADVNAKSKSGESVLEFAEMSSRRDMIDLLKENGAKE